MKAESGIYCWWDNGSATFARKCIPTSNNITTNPSTTSSSIATPPSTTSKTTYSFWKRGACITKAVSAAAWEDPRGRRLVAIYWQLARQRPGSERSPAPSCTSRYPRIANTNTIGVILKRRFRIQPIWGNPTVAGNCSCTATTSSHNTKAIH